MQLAASHLNSPTFCQTLLFSSAPTPALCPPTFCPCFGTRALQLGALNRVNRTCNSEAAAATLKPPYFVPVLRH
jgi:hypothetical protein